MCVRACVRARAWAPACVHTCVHACVRACVRARTCVSACVRAYLDACIHTSMHVYMYTYQLYWFCSGSYGDSRWYAFQKNDVDSTTDIRKRINKDKTSKVSQLHNTIPTIKTKTIGELKEKLHEPVKRLITYKNIEKMIPKAQQEISTSLLKLTANSMKKDTKARKKYKEIVKHTDKKVKNSINSLVIPQSHNHYKENKVPHIKNQIQRIQNTNKHKHNNKIEKNWKKKKSFRENFYHFLFPRKSFSSPF